MKVSSSILLWKSKFNQFISFKLRSSQNNANHRRLFGRGFLQFRSTRNRFKTRTKLRKLQLAEIPRHFVRNRL